MVNKILLYLLWCSVWLVLTWPPQASDVILALVVGFIVSSVTGDLFRSVDRGAAAVRGIGLFDKARRLPWLLWYIVVFAVECVKANIDVAWRVIHPRLPIRPGTVKVKTSLSSDIGLTFLANSITLTPGTTTVDVDKEEGCLYIHCLSMRETAEASARATVPVVEKFERILRKVFE